MFPCSAGALHRDLNARALLYARERALLHDLTPGRNPSVLFGLDEGGRHGNFYPSSFRAILACEHWRVRLTKAHTAGKRARPRADWHWRELDCAASSDALLMNVFCCPGTLRSERVCSLLGIGPGGIPEFGHKPRLERERGLVDTTEIDMSVDGLLVEAKLTESGFQTARPALLDRYPGWREGFEEEALPRTAGGQFTSWQLLRGVLAAEAAGGQFCLLCDARRTDLIAAWQRVIAAVGSAALRCRLRVMTWQELAAVLPRGLQGFLQEKYGIAGAQHGSS